MSFNFAEGSRFYFSNTLAAAKTVTAATNADPSVLSSTSHGYTDGDILLFSSGWEDATDSLWKADQLTADTFSLLGLNSTDTNFYPAGSGTGTTQKISGWTEIPQVLSVSTTGGDARFTNVDLLAKRNSLAVPTGFNAASLTLTLAHDPANANYQAMLTIARALSKVGLKIVLGGGSVAYGYGYLSVSEMPNISRNQVNQVNAAFSIIGRLVSYSS